MKPDGDDERLADLWLARFFCDEDGAYPDAAQSEDVAAALAFLDQGFSERIDKLDAHTKVLVQLLARALKRQRSDQRVERTAHTAELADALARIGTLEDALRVQAEEHAAALKEMRTQLAGLERSVARDRSLRRLTDARRSYPRPDKIALESARKKTDRLLEGGLNG